MPGYLLLCRLLQALFALEESDQDKLQLAANTIQSTTNKLEYIEFRERLLARSGLLDAITRAKSDLEIVHKLRDISFNQGKVSGGYGM